jgi:hypothetical protein
MRHKAQAKANGRQDEQDLQDGFCLGPNKCDAVVSIESSSSILPILSKNQVQ